MLKKISFVLFFAVLLSSCVSRTSMAYYTNIDTLEKNANAVSYVTKLQADDLVSIVVMGENSEVVAPFNAPLSTASASTTGAATSASTATSSYLLDSKGSIQFPVIGLVTLAGLTKAEAEALLVQKISKYVKNPTVTLRILNFKISVQGEVTAPGTYPITTERVTLIEALSLAGDLTIFGKRNNILLLREQNGVKEAVRLDITKADFINSPYYYLAQNDVLYVEPNKTKINGSAVGPNIGLIFSAVSLVVTIVVLTVQ